MSHQPTFLEICASTSGSHNLQSSRRIIRVKTCKLGDFGEDILLALSRGTGGIHEIGNTGISDLDACQTNYPGSSLLCEVGAWIEWS